MILIKFTMLITTCLLALMAGLFYAYACSVNLGLGRLSDTEYLRAMQLINRAILNPWFFVSFFGTLIMMPFSTWYFHKVSGADLSFYLILAATLVYYAGVFGVTVLGNVPLNQSLDRFDIGSATLQEIDSKRRTFEIPWNKLNLIRTLANLLSLILFVGGIIKKY